MLHGVEVLSRRAAHLLSRWPSVVVARTGGAAYESLSPRPPTRRAREGPGRPSLGPVDTPGLPETASIGGVQLQEVLPRLGPGTDLGFADRSSVRFAPPRDRSATPRVPRPRGGSATRGRR